MNVTTTFVDAIKGLKIRVTGWMQAKQRLIEFLKENFKELNSDKILARMTRQAFDEEEEVRGILQKDQHVEEGDGVEEGTRRIYTWRPT